MLVIGNRKRLDLFVNHRPIRLLPACATRSRASSWTFGSPARSTTWCCRENTEDAYSGKTTELKDGEGRVVGKTTAIEITRAATSELCRYAYALARERKKRGRPGKVTCVTKSNIIGAHKFFEDVYREVGKAEFPDIEQDTSLFDAFCMWQIRNPEWFLDVAVAPNLVGDVISDNGSTTQGGMGMAAGGNIGDRHGMFEPIHGSAPRYRGQDKVNPMAAVLGRHDVGVAGRAARGRAAAPRGDAPRGRRRGRPARREDAHLRPGRRGLLLGGRLRDLRRSRSSAFERPIAEVDAGACRCKPNRHRSVARAHGDGFVLFGSIRYIAST